MVCAAAQHLALSGALGGVLGGARSNRRDPFSRTLMTQPPDQDRATQQLGGRTLLHGTEVGAPKRRAEQTTMDPSR